MSRQIERSSSRNDSIETVASAISSARNGHGFSLSAKEVGQGKIVNSVSGSSRVRIANTSNNFYNAPVVINNIYNRYGDNVEPSPEENPTAAGNKYSKRFFSAFRGRVEQLRTTKYYIVVPILLLLAVVLIIALAIWLFNFKNTHQPHPPSPSNGTSGQQDLRIVSRAEWHAKPPKAPATPLSSKPPPLVIISHTVTTLCYIMEQCVILVRTMQNDHMFNKTWDDIAYNFLVGGDGLVYEGRGWDVAGAHSRSYNWYSIGIALIGTFELEEPTKRQLRATQLLMEYGVKNGYIDGNYKLLGHRQCREGSGNPGDVLYGIITTWDHWSPRCIIP